MMFRLFNIFALFMILGCSFCLYLFYTMVAEVNGGFMVLHLTQQIIIGLFSVGFLFGLLLFTLVFLNNTINGGK